MADMQACIEVDWSCLTEEQQEALDPVKKARAELFAQTAIRVLTGGQVGTCPITVRPCVASFCETSIWAPWSGLPWVPFIRDGVWYNGCGCRARDCSCSRLTEIHLDGPVGGVPIVKVDGVELVSGADFRVDVRDTLVRLDGPEWPTCQDMAKPDTEVGTMSVTYVKGVALDSMGQFVAGLLAQQYLLACEGGKGCRLPSSVVSIVRQGTTMEFGRSVFPNNRTGIIEVDLWVQSWNPYGVKSPATVFNPDLMAPRQTQWV